ncbi:hypothetical protein [Streptomyces violaceorubidus]|uniref:hypothetical protein n=1 Tax=Streptomyces violaceorubidus TaxID=284042 RepID=UPI0004BF4856|nr:hypothetical protein [Streptomyces violaceorubidus]
MTRLDTTRDEVRNVPDRSRGRVVAGPGGALTRAAMLAGALVSSLVGGVLVVAPVGTVTAAGAFFGVHMAVQGALQLLAVHDSGASKPVGRLLFAGGVAALLLGAALVHGWVDTVFLLGVWTGCGWLLRGLTMALSVTSSSVSHVFVYDDLLNAAIVSAGLFMTAFPFSSLGTLTHVGGSALMVIGVVEAIAAARRHPRTLRAID